MILFQQRQHPEPDRQMALEILKTGPRLAKCPTLDASLLRIFCYDRQLLPGTLHLVTERGQNKHGITENNVGHTRGSRSCSSDKWRL